MHLHQVQVQNRKIITYDRSLKQTCSQDFPRAPLAFKNSMTHDFSKSHYISQFATFFIDVGAKTSPATGCISINHNDQMSLYIGVLLFHSSLGGAPKIVCCYTTTNLWARLQNKICNPTECVCVCVDVCEKKYQSNTQTNNHTLLFNTTKVPTTKQTTCRIRLTLKLWICEWVSVWRVCLCSSRDDPTFYFTQYTINVCGSMCVWLSLCDGRIQDPSTTTIHSTTHSHHIHCRPLWGKTHTHNLSCQSFLYFTQYTINVYVCVMGEYKIHQPPPYTLQTFAQ